MIRRIVDVLVSLALLLLTLPFMKYLDADAGVSW